MAYPEQTAIAVFLAPQQRLLASAFGCLVHEIEKTTFGSSESQIAAVKLAWWRQELLGAAAGNPRHPISTVLFADARTRSIPADAWVAIVDGAIAVLDDVNASSLRDLLVHYAALYTPVAGVECQLFDGDPHQVGELARLWAITHCLRALPGLDAPDAHPALPLDLLARHGLTRSMLAKSSAARAQAVRDYLTMLASSAREAFAAATTATLSRGVRTQLDLRRMHKAAQVSDPFAWLVQHAQASRWTELWLTWNEARRVARTRLKG